MLTNSQFEILSRLANAPDSAGRALYARVGRRAGKAKYVKVTDAHTRLISLEVFESLLAGKWLRRLQTIRNLEVVEVWVISPEGYLAVNEQVQRENADFARRVAMEAARQATEFLATGTERARWGSEVLYDFASDAAGGRDKWARGR